MSWPSRRAWSAPRGCRESSDRGRHERTAGPRAALWAIAPIPGSRGDPAQARLRRLAAHAGPGAPSPRRPARFGAAADRLRRGFPPGARSTRAGGTRGHIRQGRAVPVHALRPSPPGLPERTGQASRRRRSVSRRAGAAPDRRGTGRAALDPVQKLRNEALGRGLGRPGPRGRRRGRHAGRRQSRAPGPEAGRGRRPRHPGSNRRLGRAALRGMAASPGPAHRGRDRAQRRPGARFRPGGGARGALRPSVRRRPDRLRAAGAEIAELIESAHSGAHRRRQDRRPRRAPERGLGPARRRREAGTPLPGDDPDARLFPCRPAPRQPARAARARDRLPRLRNDGASGPRHTGDARRDTSCRRPARRVRRGARAAGSGPLRRRTRPARVRRRRRRTARPVRLPPAAGVAAGRDARQILQRHREIPRARTRRAVLDGQDDLRAREPRSRAGPRLRRGRARGAVRAPRRAPKALPTAVG